MKIINSLPKLVDINQIGNELNSKAPIDHASEETSYGAGSDNKYGHVKLSDNYKESAGTASEGVAASSKAVADAYDAAVDALNWKSVTMVNDGRDYTTLPNAREYNIEVTVTDGSYYYFHTLHLIGSNYYHGYRFNDGESKASILIDNGKIRLINAYINTTDVSTTSRLNVKYR